MSELSPNLAGADRFESAVERVEKPWGYEIVFALTKRYCGKALVIRKGEQLSLQFHREKDEVVYVQQGRIELEVAGETEVVGAGRAFRFVPNTVHRWRALEDTTVLEVSTPQLDDVVRLEDLYGREGTSEA